MKKVLAQATKYIFGVFGIAILGLLMSLTYQALQRIFPTSFINTIWGLVLFDIAAICWALAFVFGSETVTQYAVSAIGFLVGFLGTLGMVAAEVILGQSMFVANAEQISQWLVYGFIGATALHAALLYGHHAGAQEIKQRIDVGIARGEITTEAIKQATATLDAERGRLAETITREIVDQVKRDLNIPILADPRMPFLPADPKQYEQAIPHPTIQDQANKPSNPFPKPTE
jgi:apolipoprotein N-acyltransferase